MSFAERFADKRDALRDFWVVYEAQQEAMRVASLAIVRRHPIFGPMFEAMPLEEMEKQNATSRENLRRACIDGHWDGYVASLHTQGTMYAQMRLPFSSFYDILRIVDNMLVPALVTEYGTEPARLCRVLGAMGELFDQAMAVIAERYIESKEEDRFRVLVDAIQDYAIFLLDTEGGVTSWNAGAQAATGYAPSEIVGKPLSTFYPPEERETKLRIALESARQTGRYDDEGWRVRKDGTRFWASAILTAVKDVNGEVVAFAKVVHDLTERRRVEEALRTSEESLSTTLHSIGDAVIATDKDGNIVRMNPVAEELTGWRLADARAEPFAKVFNVVSEHTGERAQNPVDKVLREGVVMGLANHTTLIAKDGSSRPIADSAAPIRGVRGELTGVVVVFRDMTKERNSQRQIKDMNEELERRVIDRTRELRESEEQLRQSQKIDAIGRLAGGIAHDFNNLLSVILSYGEMMSTELPADATEARAELVEIRKAARRAADLTRQLLAFSRRQVLEPKVTDLNEVLAGMEKMLARLIGEHIEVRLAPSAALALVMVDPGQIEQVVMNLAVNARDAMPNGGMLTLETTNVELDESYAEHHAGVRPGPHVMVAVTDSGEGMDQATLERIFEPFFTTKGVGKGTGLGLSTVHGIVNQSGGHLWVYSELAKGTTFKIYFPVAEQHRKTSSTALRAQSPRGSETLLLVEDEAQVRQLAKTVLERQGYIVHDADSGVSALAFIAKHQGKIDLLLTDVVMPKMGGRELVEQVAKLRPETKVLFMSGFTDDTVVHHGVLDAGIAFLQKPITPDALARKVRAVLDAP